jgi:hypothetical protein
VDLLKLVRGTGDHRFLLFHPRLAGDGIGFIDVADRGVPVNFELRTTRSNKFRVAATFKNPVGHRADTLIKFGIAK